MKTLLGNVKNGLDKGFAKASIGSKNILEKAKINSAINTLEDEKQQLTMLLGSKVLNFCKENPQDDIPKDSVISFCQEIEKRDEQIALQKQKMAELEAEMSKIAGVHKTKDSVICKCGFENSAGSRFCSNCGCELS